MILHFNIDFVFQNFPQAVKSFHLFIEYFIEEIRLTGIGKRFGRSDEDIKLIWYAWIISFIYYVNWKLLFNFGQQQWNSMSVHLLFRQNDRWVNSLYLELGSANKCFKIQFKQIKIYELLSERNEIRSVPFHWESRCNLRNPHWIQWKSINLHTMWFHQYVSCIWMVGESECSWYGILNTLTNPFAFEHATFKPIESGYKPK